MPPSKLKPLDELFERAVRNYGKAVPEHFKDEVYRPLLDQMAARNVPTELVERCSYWTKPPLSGTVSDCFPLLETPRKLYRLEGIVGSMHCSQTWVCFIPQRHLAKPASHLYVLYRNGGLRDGLWARHTLLRKLSVCAMVLEERDLPYDMRTWDPSFISAYFQTDMAGLSHTKVRDILRTEKVFSMPLNKRENLVRLRTINPHPSRAQEKKITGNGNSKRHPAVDYGDESSDLYNIAVDGSAPPSAGWTWKSAEWPSPSGRLTTNALESMVSELVPVNVLDQPDQDEEEDDGYDDGEDNSEDEESVLDE